MAVLNVTYSRVGGTNKDTSVPPVMNGSSDDSDFASEDVTIGGVSAATTATSTAASGFGVVRLHAEAACYVKIGASPTAAAEDMRMAAGQTEHVALNKGDKVACITV